MFTGPVFFEDRADAGRRLALAVAAVVPPAPLVMALPRGGVPVAFEIAMHLDAPLEVLIVRKIGAPGHQEFGLGALVDGDEAELVLNPEAVRLVRPARDYIAAETERQREEIARRRVLYRGDREPLSPKGRNVVLVDDGIATGGTIRAAIQALRRAGVRSLLLAVPVAPASAIASLRPLVEAIVCLSTPAFFRAVGLHYRDFEQTSDAEVMALLRKARYGEGA
ncbi:phosphoribosyltransferase [Sinorhizobium sp. A49]|uniref:phosphoribosyltransferase n=1 Tax=Sinorhizobium sp. A49 TaxID=1945861 RepID=UPI000986A71E|nr:phosphoribosyltransferase [Sinorhizobium sp. A49]OOG73468.1 phosphoribosyltransferase [Sinorhizobium sp. A49]